MGTAHIPRDVLLFCSVLFGNSAPVEQVISALRKEYGEFVYRSEAMPFTFTSYYEEELGSPLYRILLAFETLVPRDSLPGIKIRTNEMEFDFMTGDKRTVNLDPGFLSQENICLATTKPYSHRIYLSRGIWAEITLIYKKNSYQTLEWTYPDYASDELIRIFHELRELYKGRLRCQEA